MSGKLLTVDDSRTIRLIVTRAFQDYDLAVFEAPNGVEGLAMAARERPDLILLDDTMPMMDGYEMLTKVRSDPALKTIPVIMLTAETDRESALKIARQGVRDHLIKPFRKEFIVERVGRIIDLKPRSEAAPKARRYDDPLQILVVDDKPAIISQLGSGLKDTAWQIEGATSAAQAMERCGRAVPDVVLVSLSLPENGGYTLFQMMRAGARTKPVPVFGLCVKTAVEDQARARQVGFSGTITKPIDFEEVKRQLTRALGLDTSDQYFVQQDGVLVLQLPPTFNPSVAGDILRHLRNQVTGAVDAGLDKLVIDLSPLQTADITLIKLGLSALQLCAELAVKSAFIGSEAVTKECKHYAETKDWRFVTSHAEALSVLGAPPASA